jgi:hypothetical protein
VPPLLLPQLQPKAEYFRDTPIELLFDEPMQSSHLGRQLNVSSTNGGLDGSWLIDVDGPEVIFDGTHKVIIQLASRYFLQSNQDSESYVIVAPPDAFVDYGNIPNAFAGGVLIELLVVSTAGGASVAPAVVAAGQTVTLDVSFDVRVPLTSADEIILTFPSLVVNNAAGVAAGAATDISEVKGARTIAFPLDLMDAFEPVWPFSAGVLYADLETNSVVITELSLSSTTGFPPSPGAPQRVEFKIEEVQFPALYGTLGPYTVAVRYGSGVADANMVALGPVLANLWPPVFDQDQYTVAIAEVATDAADATIYTGTATNNAAGSFVPQPVVTVQATDPDGLSDTQVTYHIDATDLATKIYFKIDSVSGAVTTKVPLDYDDKTTPNQFEFKVLAADGSFPFSESSVTVQVNITDLNDNAPIFTNLNNNLPYYSVVLHEATLAVGGSILTLQASDRDSGANGNVRFAFGAGTTEAARQHFSMNGTTGEIVIEQLFVPTTVTTRNHITFPVIATDQNLDQDVQLSQTISVSVSVIGDLDLNFMVVDPVGELSRAAFTSVIESVVCPGGGCQAVLHNVSLAISSLQTTVAYYVQSLPQDVNALTFDLVAPTEMDKILESSASQQVLASQGPMGGFTFVSVGTAAPPPPPAAAAKDPYSGLTLEGVVMLGVGSLFVCLIVFVIVHLKRRDDDPNNGLQLHHSRSSSMYMDPQPHSMFPGQNVPAKPARQQTQMQSPNKMPSNWHNIDQQWPSSPYMHAGQSFASPQMGQIDDWDEVEQHMNQQAHAALLNQHGNMNAMSPRPTQFRSPGRTSMQQPPFNQISPGRMSSGYAVATSPGRMSPAPNAMGMGMGMGMGRGSNYQFGPEHMGPRMTSNQSRWSEQPASPGGRQTQLASAAPKVSMIQEEHAGPRWSDGPGEPDEWNTVTGALAGKSGGTDMAELQRHMDAQAALKAAALKGNRNARRPPALSAGPPQTSNNGDGTDEEDDGEVEYAAIDFAATNRTEQGGSVPTSPTGRAHADVRGSMTGPAPALSNAMEQALLNEGDEEFYGQEFSGLAPMEQTDFRRGSTEYVDVGNESAEVSAAEMRRTNPHMQPTQSY